MNLQVNLWDSDRGKAFDDDVKIFRKDVVIIVVTSPDSASMKARLPPWFYFLDGEVDGGN